MARHYWLKGCTVVLATVGSPAVARAQCDHPQQFGVVALGIEAGALALDRPVHRWITEGQNHTPGGATKSLVSAAGYLGEAKVLIPGMVGAYLITLLTRHREASHGVLRIGAGYVTSDAVTGILKPVVGRARPTTVDNPYVFHSFSGTDAYHSFPSGHLTHFTSIVAGALAEFPSPPVRAASFVLPAFVGWQRIYTNAHWLSDVAGGSIVGIEGRCLAHAVLGTHW